LLIILTYPILYPGRKFSKTASAYIRVTSEDSSRDPPEVDVTPPTDLPTELTPWRNVPLPIDILLLTKEEVELLSCISCLNASFFKSYHEKLGELYFRDIGEEETMTLKIAVIKHTQAVLYDDNNFLTFIKDALQVLEPKCVFWVGYCGGLDYKKVKLGDVVLSKMLLTYTSEPMRRASTIIPRGDICYVQSNLGEGWFAPLRVPEELDVKVHRSGVFLCVPEVLDSVERRDELTQQFPEATAVASEGFGKSFIIA